MLIAGSLCATLVDLGRSAGGAGPGGGPNLTGKESWRSSGKPTGFTIETTIRKTIAIA